MSNKICIIYDRNCKDNKLKMYHYGLFSFSALTFIYILQNKNLTTSCSKVGFEALRNLFYRENLFPSARFVSLSLCRVGDSPSTTTEFERFHRHERRPGRTATRAQLRHCLCRLSQAKAGG